MTLALSSDYPVLDVFWTMLVVFGLALLLWTLIVVFRDLFGRTDIGAWRTTLWVVVVLVFPIAGSLGYLITRSAAMGDQRLRANSSTDLRMDAHLRAVAGDDGFYGVRDATATRAAMIGPVRSD